jgi:hypothetical protein
VNEGNDLDDPRHVFSSIDIDGIIKRRCDRESVFIPMQSYHGEIEFHLCNSSRLSIK